MDGRYVFPVGEVRVLPTVRADIGSRGRSGASWRRLVDRTRRPDPSLILAVLVLLALVGLVVLVLVVPVERIVVDGVIVFAVPAFPALLHPQPTCLVRTRPAHVGAGGPARQGNRRRGPR